MKTNDRLLGRFCFYKNTCMTPKKIAETIVKDFGQKIVYSMIEPNTAGDMELIIEEGNFTTRIKFRNVGKRNENSSLQFTIRKFNRRTNRTTYGSFSVPLPLVSIFLEHLQNDKR